MSTDVLIPNKMLESADAALAEAFTVHRLYEAADPDAMLAEIAPKIGAIASSGGAKRPMIEALPNLKLVAHFGVGYDPVDVDCCKEHDIRVTNTPDVLNDAVAEMTLGLMLALERRIPHGDRHVRDGKWEAGGYPLTGELTGKTAGIMGLGRIGKEIARRLQVMKMNVVYNGRTEQKHEPYPYFAALISCLSDGSLGGAALDVFEDEPRVPQALREMDNVVLQPHQGSATHKTRWGMGDLVVRNIKAHFAGEPLITPVA